MIPGQTEEAAPLRFQRSQALRSHPSPSAGRWLSSCDLLARDHRQERQAGAASTASRSRPSVQALHMARAQLLQDDTISSLPTTSLSQQQLRADLTLQVRDLREERSCPKDKEQGGKAGSEGDPGKLYRPLGAEVDPNPLKD